MKSRRNLAEIVAIVVVLSALALYHQKSRRTEVSSVREATKGVTFSTSYGLARLSNAFDDPFMAKRLLDKHLRQFPDDPRGYFQRGLADLGCYDYEEAAADFQRSLDLDPNQPKAWNNLSYAHAQLWKFQEALDAADRSIEVNPDYSNAHGSRAYALLGLGRNKEAQASFERALALDPKDNISAWGRYEAIERQQLGKSDTEAAFREASKTGGQPWFEWPAPTAEEGVEQ